jgi:hypothetical protein
MPSPKEAAIPTDSRWRAMEGNGSAAANAGVLPAFPPVDNPPSAGWPSIHSNTSEINTRGPSLVGPGTTSPRPSPKPHARRWTCTVRVSLDPQGPRDTESVVVIAVLCRAGIGHASLRTIVKLHPRAGRLHEASHRRSTATLDRSFLRSVSMRLRIRSGIASTEAKITWSSCRIRASWMVLLADSQ